MPRPHFWKLYNTEELTSPVCYPVCFLWFIMIFSEHIPKGRLPHRQEVPWRAHEAPHVCHLSVL